MESAPCLKECFHSRGQHLCKFIGTKESVSIRKEFNSHRTGLGRQHGRRFIVLGHQYGRHDVMWKHSIPSPQSVFYTDLSFPPVCKTTIYEKSLLSSSLFQGFLVIEDRRYLLWLSSSLFPAVNEFAKQEAVIRWRKIWKTLYLSGFTKGYRYGHERWRIRLSF